MKAQHSKVYKTVCYGSSTRLVPPQSCLKVPKNLPFSAKMTENKPFLMKKENSSELWDDFAQNQDVLEEHKRPLLKTSEFGAFSYKGFKALRAVLLTWVKIEN